MLDKTQRAGKGREVQSGSSLCTGCGGEGSWHRDLMHKEKQKSHCQGFPLLHSSADDPAASLYFHCGMLLSLVSLTVLFSQLISDTGCCYGVKGINIGEVRQILWRRFWVDSEKLTCGIRLSHGNLWKNSCLQLNSVKIYFRLQLNAQLSEIYTVFTAFCFQISEAIDINAYESHTASCDGRHLYREITFQVLDFKFMNKELTLMFKMKTRILHWQHMLRAKQSCSFVDTVDFETHQTSPLSSHVKVCVSLYFLKSQPPTC